ncbi:hypothetical protein [Parvularcula lutaonensis]|uniref:Uncharacterized protein n=1 Tax=Parvularcula lutaonensis TaxID=491923 RepID=A0ABV7ME95_9PROT|nr:hypothetical protein [Parvularcula lutaonensis]GGY51088.1 hypothetical protein GCM10007148_19930 [Parvularcula lutaonensis]
MLMMKKRAAKVVLAGVAASMLGGFAALGIAAATGTEDDPCPCPWWFRLPWNPSVCMIEQPCDLEP